MDPITEALSCLPSDSPPETQIARLLNVGGACTEEGLRRLLALQRERGEPLRTVRAVAGALVVQS